MNLKVNEVTAKKENIIIVYNEHKWILALSESQEEFF
jgi:hypothetical protein